MPKLFFSQRSASKREKNNNNNNKPYWGMKGWSRKMSENMSCDTSGKPRDERSAIEDKERIISAQRGSSDIDTVQESPALYEMAHRDGGDCKS
jgi:hypothetical protein